MTILFLPLALLLWAYIHELCHVIMAKKLLGATDCKIIPYPHYYEGHWYFARTQWVVMPEKISDKYMAITLLAPRIPNLIAVTVFSLYDNSFWLVFWGVGLLDLFVGSLGITKQSDLRRGSELLGISPWWLRISGMSLLMMTIIVWVSKWAM